ncbi:MAG: cytochrome c peroxidase [bacterium]
MLVLPSTSTANPQLGMRTAPKLDKIEAELGKRLFFDRRLSVNGTLSCAMCHIPEQGFTQNQMATPVGFKGRSVKRNSPTLLNVAYRQVLFFDGREFTLHDQVWSPLLSAREMGNVSIGSVIARLQQLDDYASVFRQVYGEDITAGNIGAALAAYEQTLIAAGSPFDQWYFGKLDSAVGDGVKSGFALFMRHGCIQCHTVDASQGQFTDDDFHNTGIGFARTMQDPVRGTRIIKLAETISIQTEESFEGDNLNDLGRYEMTGHTGDRWKYRTPTLRNVALTSPYMHDGSLSSLEDVISFYADGGVPNEGLDDKIKPLNLTRIEISQLVLFLQSLTSPHVQDLIEAARSVQIGDY